MVEVKTLTDTVMGRRRGSLGGAVWNVIRMLGLAVGVLSAVGDVHAQQAGQMRSRTLAERGLTGATLDVRVSADGTMRLDGVVSDSTSASRRVRSLIRQHPPGVVRFGTERGLPYEAYIQHLDTLKAAYVAEWDGISFRDYGIPYERLKPSAREVVQAEIPLGIVLAEPGEGD